MCYAAAASWRVAVGRCSVGPVGRLWAHHASERPIFSHPSCVVDVSVYGSAVGGLIVCPSIRFHTHGLFCMHLNDFVGIKTASRHRNFELLRTYHGQIFYERSTVDRDVDSMSSLRIRY